MVKDIGINKQYIINKVEKLINKYGLDITNTYGELGNLYQSIYGVNLFCTMHEDGFDDMLDYLYYKGQNGYMERFLGIVNVYEKEMLNV